jgi:hypothetical protein
MSNINNDNNNNNNNSKMIIIVFSIIIIILPLSLFRKRDRSARSKTLESW